MDILDCTLRDGSYVNQFQFTQRDTRLLCQRLQHAGVKYIEIGHGLGLGAYRQGGKLAAAASDEEYLLAARSVLSTAKFGVFCIPGIASLEDIDLAARCGADFIRVGANVTDIEPTADYIERAKNHGMFVCSNYMKSYVVSPKVICEKARLSQSYGADLVYLVDSAGGMLPEDIKAYIKALSEGVDIPFGYHGHNNLGLAVANSVLCAQLGASLIDTSLQGFGRSAGNASTEQTLLFLSRLGIEHGIDLLEILDVGYDLIQPMVRQTGLNPIDMVAGFALFHSSYMPLIKKYSNQYCVDPKELIIALCEKDQLDAPEALVKSLAEGLLSKDIEVFSNKYHMERFYVNEQRFTDLQKDANHGQ